MNFGVEFGSGVILFVALEQQLSGLLIKGAFGVRRDEETSDREKDVLDPKIRLPVFLQSVDANFAGPNGHVRVEDLGEEEALRRRFRKVSETVRMLVKRIKFQVYFATFR